MALRLAFFLESLEPGFTCAMSAVELLGRTKLVGCGGRLTCVAESSAPQQLGFRFSPRECIAAVCVDGAPEVPLGHCQSPLGTVHHAFGQRHLPGEATPVLPITDNHANLREVLPRLERLTS